MKICKKCGIEKEFTEFYKSKRTEDGYDTRCKFCVNNVAKITIEEKLCKGCNEIKNINDFHKNKTSKDGYENKCIMCRRKMNNDNYVKVKEELNLKRKNKRNENLDKVHEYYNNYSRLNRYKYDNEKTILRKKLSKIIRRVFLNKNLKKNNKTISIIGCTLMEFKIYIENKFETWMNWDNHGNYTGNYNETWQFDHIIPISIAKTEEDIIKLNHYTNFQPLCSKKNMEKSNLIMTI